MPAQKRCLSENLDDEEQHQHHAKQSRPHPQSLVDDEVIVDDDDDDEAGQHLELQPQDQQVKEEDDEDEEGGGGGEEEEDGDGDGDDDEAEDKQTVKQQQQHEKEKEENEEEEDAEAEDSQGSPSSNLQEKPEFVFVQLTDIRKDVQCPICLGIIKKTRTVMECLHRFCRECIDKSMRMGNNECPACRTHCASRRSLRDDPNYDALIAALYPDIDKYEEEELAFHEEEMTRNKQRQSEALVKRRQLGNTPSTFTTRSQRNNRNTHSRRRSCRGIELQGSEDNEDENDNKDSSSADEQGTELRQRRRKRRAGTRSSQPSSSAANSDGGCIENDLEVSRENRGISPGLVWNPEMLAWGRAGTRSHTRHGNASGYNSKSAQSTRLSKLVEYLRSLEEKNDELDIHLMLRSLDLQSIPRLQQPHLCCRPSLSVKHLCEYIARQVPLQAEEIEILALKGQETSGFKANRLLEDAGDPGHAPILEDPCLHILEGQETLGGLKANCISKKNHLILAYRRKVT
ncbi:putative E3 ubiquitin-protein ligase RING1a isoform X2 [Quercus robur]|uniref:putative E3 ubiquitin-protein ligase RING1a isoform X2 n=1 Tax=Quercus robur TaxID=38942 RepID=UPI002161FC53|nr:putative E3 ubiquitin-protein ligase RING1a isoform X2 [Quercus robur]